jgi:Kef-type K+ transport system membrane component KefB
MLNNHPILVVMMGAVLAPLLTEVPIGVRAPVVVVEVLFGILVGPQVIRLVDPRGLGGLLFSMQIMGAAAVLFMAGMEVDFNRIRGRPLSLGLLSWFASIVLAFAAVALLHVVPGVHAPLMVTIALTTTSLGALIPLLRDGGQLDAPFGRMLLADGTIGEVGPIVAVSLVLSSRYTTWQEFSLLIAFLALVGVATAVGIGARPPKVLALLSRTMHASTQLPVRVALFVLAAFVTVASTFGFEGILGAFAAGMIVGLATRGEEGETFRAKIDAVCFGFLTPFFFVGTGIEFDPAALTRETATMLLTPGFLFLFLMIRGAPVILFRNELPKPERLAFALSASVASLALVVVITDIGLLTKYMKPDIAEALVAASLLSLLLYPTLAGILLSRNTPSANSFRVVTAR